MKKIDPLSIRILGDPQPDAVEPAILKAAYAGLRLDAVALVEAGETYFLPHGAYMVPIDSLLRAMATHDMRAYQCLVAMWGDILNIVDERRDGHSPVLLPFPCDLCEVVQ